MAGTVTKAKRFLLGLFFSTFSILAVRRIMDTLYTMLSRPFDESPAAGIAYYVVMGALSVALCQTLLVLTADRKLAVTATRCVAMIYALVLFLGLGTGIIVLLAKGASLSPALNYVPAIAITVPWVAAAIFAHRRLIIEWTPRRSADPPLQPPE